MNNWHVSLLKWLRMLFPQSHLGQTSCSYDPLALFSFTMICLHRGAQYLHIVTQLHICCPGLHSIGPRGLQAMFFSQNPLAARFLLHLANENILGRSEDIQRRKVFQCSSLNIVEIVDGCCSLQGVGGCLWGYRRSGWSSRTRDTSLAGLLAPYSSLPNSRTLPQLRWLFLTLGSHTPCISALITRGSHKDQRYLLHFSFAPLAPRGLLMGLLYSASPV